jgi:hypothetical protein
MHIIQRSARWLSFLLLFFALAARARADQTLAGYRTRLAGEVIAYHAPDPDVTSGLLVRSLDASRAIEWETEPAPAAIDGEFASFIWMFALQVDPAGHRFGLSVDGEPWLEFRNPPTNDVRDWTINGPRGASLRFRATMIDRFNDLMGYAILRVPRASLIPGKPLRIRVSGESAGSRAWYITFQAAAKERAELAALPAVVRDAVGNYQPLVLSVIHLGEPVDAIISTSFGKEERRTLELGGNRFDLRHPEVKEPTDITVRVRVADKDVYVLSATVAPVRHWTVNLVQHAHTDVGYTRPQTEILPEHLRYIDTALDYCDQTDSYPPDAQFRWTCEASWPVREYLRSRTPEQIARLRRRAKEGRIEVTGMFLNMSEVMDEAGYASFLEPVREIRDQGLPVTTAMQDDVNGVAWCLADYFPAAKIDYLVMGVHGHRSLIPFDTPTAFWWESPAGNRVLAFRADHYMTGNFWGVHTGKVDIVEQELLRYLSHLEKAGYPFDRVAVQHSGYPTDNSPPSIASSELAQKWNQQFVWPHLRCAVAREFPEYVKNEHPRDIPVIKKAWVDWWTDGFGSAARETAAARVTQSHLNAVESLFAMESAMGLAPMASQRSDVSAVRDALIFWGEHSMGADESIRQPLCENSQVQWDEKAAYAWDAVKREATLGEGAIGRLQAVVKNASTPRLLVVNTLNFQRSELLELYADNALLPYDRAFRIVDDQGQPLPVQLLRSRAEGNYWSIWARDIPAFGWREFKIEVDPSSPARPTTPTHNTEEIESEHYRVAIDSKRGGIKDLTDKETGSSLIDPGAEWLLGQVVHETLGNREQLEGFMLESYARHSLENVVVEGASDGPIWTSLAFHGDLPGCQGPGGVRCEVRLYHPEKRMDLLYTIQKRRVYDPEAIYVAFPFAPNAAGVSYETIGATVSPTTDIIPRSASDWQAAQAFARVQWPSGQIVVSSPEIPLFQFGAINTGKFQTQLKVERPHVFSWVMNNYWTTNFCASQEGEFRWSYALTSKSDPSVGKAYRFGWSRRIPLLGRVLAGGGAERPLEHRSLIAMDAPNLILVAARPASHGAGLIVHLREVDGKATRLDASSWQLAGRPVRVHEVSALEDELSILNGAADFGPFQTKFLWLEPK